MRRVTKPDPQNAVQPCVPRDASDKPDRKKYPELKTYLSKSTLLSGRKAPYPILPIYVRAPLCQFYIPWHYERITQWHNYWAIAVYELDRKKQNNDPVRFYALGFIDNLLQSVFRTVEWNYWIYAALARQRHDKRDFWGSKTMQKSSTAKPPHTITNSSA